MAQFIFADDTYSKPFFVTYINTSFFAVSLIPVLVSGGRSAGGQTFLQQLSAWRKGGMTRYQSLDTDDGVPKPGDETHDEDSPAGTATPRLREAEDHARPARRTDQLDLMETARLSLEFCILWFAVRFPLCL